MYIPYPEKKVFKNSVEVVDKFEWEQQEAFLIDRVEYPDKGGILIYKVGPIKPTKGFVFPEAMNAVNVLKRILHSYIDLLKTSLFFLQRKSLDKLIRLLVRPMYWVVESYLVKDEYSTEIARELRGIIRNTLDGLNVDITQARKFAEIIGAIVEYDNAYRYRMEDFFSLTTKKTLLKNPRKELKRMAEEYSKREKYKQISSKVTLGINLLRFALLRPKYAKLFHKVISECNFKNLQMDEIDEYNVLTFDNYDFFGETYEQRYKRYVELHRGKPPLAYNIREALCLGKEL